MADRVVGENCIQFYDPDIKAGVNLVPIEPGVFVPRVGERVFLPGDDGHGRGDYEVTSVRYIYAEVEAKQQPAHARQLTVAVWVTRLRS